jgi:hypothetical protein
LGPLRPLFWDFYGPSIVSLQLSLTTIKVPKMAVQFQGQLGGELAGRAPAVGHAASR